MSDEENINKVHQFLQDNLNKSFVALEIHEATNVDPKAVNRVLNSSKPPRGLKITRSSDNKFTAESVPVKGPVPESAPKLPIMFDQYRVERSFGEPTGQGRCYIVRTTDGPRLLCKELLRSDNLAKARMLREVECLRMLHDVPQIPNYIYHNHSVSRPFLVMQYIDSSQDLYSFIRERGRLKPSDAVTVLRAFSNILKKCHKRKIIHRDIKVRNILIRNARFTDIYLVDFGISYTEGDDTLTLAERCGPAMIRFPEAEVDSDKMDKRDYRTDIGYVAALLAVLLATPENGTVRCATKDDCCLVKSSDARMKLIGYPNLTKIICKGTQYNVEDRFQSLAEIDQLLDEECSEFIVGRLRKPKGSGITHELLTKELDNILNSISKSSDLFSAEVIKQDGKWKLQISPVGLSIQVKILNFKNKCFGVKVMCDTKVIEEVYLVDGDTFPPVYIREKILRGILKEIELRVEADNGPTTTTTTSTTDMTGTITTTMTTTDDTTTTTGTSTQQT